VGAFIEVFSMTNGGSEGTESRRELWVGFGGAFRELTDDRSIFVQ